MNSTIHPAVVRMRSDWDTMLARLRLPVNEFHPACDTCKVGVCCYEAVFSDEHEVVAILNALTPEQIEDLKPAVIAWYERATGLLHLEQKGIGIPWRLANIPCPLYVGGRCSVYENRPLACRAHYALEKPENCEMPARVHQKYAMFDQDKQYQLIALRYAVGVKKLRIDHLGLLLYNRLFGKSETSKACQVLDVEEALT